MNIYVLKLSNFHLNCGNIISWCYNWRPTVFKQVYFKFQVLSIWIHTQNNIYELSCLVHKLIISSINVIFLDVKCYLRTWCTLVINNSVKSSRWSCLTLSNYSVLIYRTIRMTYSKSCVWYIELYRLISYINLSCQDWRNI